jgi:hypothetical protein
VTAVIDVLLVTVTLVAAEPPSVSDAPDRKFEPVMVMEVPPAVVPELGEIAVIAGPGGGGVAPPDFGNIVLSFFVAPGDPVK